MAYITLAQVRAYLNMATAETSDDTLLTGMIPQAQAIIEAPEPLGTGRTWEASTNTARTFDSVLDVEGRTLWLDRDLASINSVTNGDGVAVSASDYVTVPKDTPYYGITLKRDASVVWEEATAGPEGAISISGKWASATTAPADIQQLCLRLVAWIYRGRETSESQGPISTPGGVILPAALPADIELMIRARQHIV